LGTGSTAYFAVERVGQRFQSGELEHIVCVPTSEKTKLHAESLGIPLATLDEVHHLDVAIDRRFGQGSSRAAAYSGRR